MVNRRQILGKYILAFFSLIFGSKTAGATSGHSLQVTITDHSVADLDVTATHEIASEVGDGIELEIADDPGLHAAGLTEFEPCFEITNSDTMAVTVSLSGDSDDIGEDGPLDFHVAGNSIVGEVPAVGIELEPNQTIRVDFSANFLEFDGRDIEESISVVDDKPVIEVTTEEATPVNDSTATLNGELQELENADTVAVWFEYGVVGEGFPDQTDADSLTEPGPFSETIPVDPDTTYEYRAHATTGGVTDVGEVETFTTDDEGCFITSATVNEPVVRDTLRDFRDESMRRTSVGDALVALYYRISPPISRTLFNHPESFPTRITRKLVYYCAYLTEKKNQQPYRIVRPGYSVLIVLLYCMGIIIGALGYFWYRFIIDRVSDSR